MNAASAPPVVCKPAAWWHYVAAALVATAISGYFLDLQLHTHLMGFRWGPNVNIPERYLSGEAAAEAQWQLDITSLWGGAFALGSIAAALALALCLVDALKWRKRASYALAPVAALIGAVGGAGGGYVGTHMYLRFWESSSGPLTMMHGVYIQVVAWLCAGLGIGLAVWIANAGRRMLVDTLFGGLLAGGLAGGLYPPVIAYFFPDTNTDRLFPDTGFFNKSLVPFHNLSFLFWAMFPSTVFAMVLSGVGRPVADSAPTSRE